MQCAVPNRGWCYNKNYLTAKGTPGYVRCGFAHYLVGQYTGGGSLQANGAPAAGSPGSWDCWKCPGMTGVAFNPGTSDAVSYLSGLAIRTTTKAIEGYPESALIVSPSIVSLWQDAVSWSDATGCANSQCTNPANIGMLKSSHGNAGMSGLTNVGYADGHASSTNLLKWWWSVAYQPPYAFANWRK